MIYYWVLAPLEADIGRYTFTVALSLYRTEKATHRVLWRDLLVPLLQSLHAKKPVIGAMSIRQSTALLDLEELLLQAQRVVGQDPHEQRPVNLWVSSHVVCLP